MRNTETVLGIIRERGRRGLPLERVYRLMWNKELFLTAYGRIYRKQRCHDARSHDRDHGRNVPGRHRRHHRSSTLRTVSVDAGQTGLHSQTQREDPSPGHPNTVGQSWFRK